MDAGEVAIVGVLLLEPELEGRAAHPIGKDAVHRSRLDGLPAGELGPGESDGRDEPSAGVWGAADDLARLSFPDVDAEKMEVVAILDLLAGEDFPDDDAARRGEGGIGADLSPGLREGRGDFFVAI